MEFGIEKCALLKMRSGKQQLMEGIELPNLEKIRTLGEKRNLQVLGNISSAHHQKAEMKKISKLNQRRKRKNSRPNYIAEITTN